MKRSFLSRLAFFLLGLQTKKGLFPFPERTENTWLRGASFFFPPTPKPNNRIKMAYVFSLLDLQELRFVPREPPTEAVIEVGGRSLNLKPFYRYKTSKFSLFKLDKIGYQDRGIAVFKHEKTNSVFYGLLVEKKRSTVLAYILEGQKISTLPELRSEQEHKIFIPTPDYDHDDPGILELAGALGESCHDGGDLFTFLAQEDPEELENTLWRAVYLHRNNFLDLVLHPTFRNREEIVFLGLRKIVSPRTMESWTSVPAFYCAWDRSGHFSQILRGTLTKLERQVVFSRDGQPILLGDEKKVPLEELVFVSNSQLVRVWALPSHSSVQAAFWMQQSESCLCELVTFPQEPHINFALYRMLSDLQLHPPILWSDQHRVVLQGRSHRINVETQSVLSTLELLNSRGVYLRGPRADMAFRAPNGLWFVDYSFGKYHLWDEERQALSEHLAGHAKDSQDALALAQHYELLSMLCDLFVDTSAQFCEACQAHFQHIARALAMITPRHFAAFLDACMDPTRITTIFGKTWVSEYLSERTSPVPLTRWNSVLRGFLPETTSMVRSRSMPDLSSAFLSR